MLKEFKEFVMRGNVFDMAIGIIIGGAFGPIVKTLVDEVIMPPLGFLIGGADFSNFFLVLKVGAKAAGPYTTVAAAREAGAVVIGYGFFANSIVSFLIVAFAVFLLVKIVNRLRREQEAAAPAPTTKECPQCLMPVPLAAKKCGHCTSAI